ncbi:MAG: hypothetical protein R2834_13095 [Rhodothermales bacterium]
MKRLPILLALLVAGVAQAQSGRDLILIPDALTHTPGSPCRYEVTLLDVRGSLTENSRIFLPDSSELQIEDIRRLGPDRLQFTVVATGNLRALGRHPFFLFTGAADQPIREGQLTVLGARPTVRRVHVRANHAVEDTLDLRLRDLTDFDLMLAGDHFYRGTRIVFEDSAFTMERVTWEDRSDSLVVHVHMQNPRPHARPLRFDVVHPFTPTLYERELPVRARPPRIAAIQPARFQAGNTRERITVLGDGFADGARAYLKERPLDDVSRPTVQPDMIQFDARIPSGTERLTVVVENMDGQIAEREATVSRDVQPAKATVRSRSGKLYFGQKQRVEFRSESERPFDIRERYILQVEGLDPMPLQPRSAGVIQAELNLPEDEGAYDVSGRLERFFTIRSADGFREWSGVLDVYLSPRIAERKPIVIRPGEQRKIALSGRYLTESTVVSDAGVIRGNTVLTDETLEITLRASTDAVPGPIELYLIRDNIRFQTIPARIVTWAEPATYVRWGYDKKTRRDMPYWSESNGFLSAPSNGQIVFSLSGDLLPADAEAQDIRLEVRDNNINTVLHAQKYRITRGMQETVLVNLDGKVEPEHILKVGLTTPQDSTNFNLVRVVRSPREKWDVTAGASVVRVSFNGDVQVLNSVGIGATYALDEKDDLGLNIGGLFIGYESRVVDFGMTGSVTFFKRLTLGMGWNLFGPGAKAAEGTLFERRGFMVIGGTFNLALP